MPGHNIHPSAGSLPAISRLAMTSCNTIMDCGHRNSNFFRCKAQASAPIWPEGFCSGRKRNHPDHQPADDPPPSSPPPPPPPPPSQLPREISFRLLGLGRVSWSFGLVSSLHPVPHGLGWRRYVVVHLFFRTAILNHPSLRVWNFFPSPYLQILFHLLKHPHCIKLCPNNPRGFISSISNKPLSHAFTPTEQHLLIQHPPRSHLKIRTQDMSCGAPLDETSLPR
jgi:hypothetical protein